ncbi:hypothetical protein EVAR_65441_1 [Eumeta japonica]|uniref:Uncharacterized protein n=1 Tax=Eumeta variegata TaxID=151549 RepID=A0A4C1ZH56_EUMVA|nr:hypothetical protein EVAR_65441_1 [Eumeta japonica]
MHVSARNDNTWMSRASDSPEEGEGWRAGRERGGSCNKIEKGKAGAHRKPSMIYDSGTERARTRPEGYATRVEQHHEAAGVSLFLTPSTPSSRANIQPTHQRRKKSDHGNR